MLFKDEVQLGWVIRHKHPFLLGFLERIDAFS
jgi:hypothetical protein